MQHALVTRTPGITPPAGTATAEERAAPAGGDRKRRRTSADKDGNADAGGSYSSAGLDALWRRVSRGYEALATFRDASLDSWHRRTVLASGSGGLRNSLMGLRALNQSISSQVQALLRDPGASGRPAGRCEGTRGGCSEDGEKRHTGPVHVNLE